MRNRVCVITSTGKRVCGKPVAKASGRVRPSGASDPVSDHRRYFNSLKNELRKTGSFVYEGFDDTGVMRFVRYTPRKNADGGMVISGYEVDDDDNPMRRSAFDVDKFTAKNMTWLADVVWAVEDEK